MRRDIEFRTEDNVVLRGWHYLPQSAGPKPTVVMCHGYSAVKEMDLDRFAGPVEGDDPPARIGAVVWANALDPGGLAGRHWGQVSVSRQGGPDRRSCTG